MFVIKYQRTVVWINFICTWICNTFPKAREIIDIINIKPIYYNKFVNLIQKIGYKKGLGIECHVVRKYKKPKNLTNYYLFGHSSGGYQVLKDRYDKNIKANIVYGATHNSNKKLYFGLNFNLRKAFLASSFR